MATHETAARDLFEIRAIWDPEASVWVAESDDVPGLITEAATVEQLVEKLEVLIPELLAANNALPPGEANLQFHLTASLEGHVRSAA